MPITVTAPRGILTPAGEREILPRLTAALAEASGLGSNAFFTSLVGGTVHVLDPGRIYAGGVIRPLVLVELKLPNIGLSSAEQRSAFIAAATDIVDALTVEDHRRHDTWVTMVNAPDGGWGIAGRSYSGMELIEAVTASQAR